MLKNEELRNSFVDALDTTPELRQAAAVVDYGILFDNRGWSTLLEILDEDAIKFVVRNYSLVDRCLIFFTKCPCQDLGNTFGMTSDGSPCVSTYTSVVESGLLHQRVIGIAR